MNDTLMICISLIVGLFLGAVASSLCSEPAAASNIGELHCRGDYSLGQIEITCKDIN